MVVLSVFEMEHVKQLHRKDGWMGRWQSGSGGNQQLAKAVVNLWLGLLRCWIGVGDTLLLLGQTSLFTIKSMLV